MSPASHHFNVSGSLAHIVKTSSDRNSRCIWVHGSGLDVTARSISLCCMGNKNPAIADGVKCMNVLPGVTSGTKQPALPFPRLGLVWLSSTY